MEDRIILLEKAQASKMAEHDAAVGELSRRISAGEQRDNIHEKDIREILVFLSRTKSEMRIITQTMLDIKTLLTEYKHDLGRNLARVDNRVEKIEERVGDIEKKPGKRWDAVVLSVITIVLGAVIGYFIKGG